MYRLVNSIVLFFLQADAKVLNALDYLYEVCKKATLKKGTKPWAVRVDIEKPEDDPFHEKVHCPRAAPVLFLYFDAGYMFEKAVICADEHKFMVDSCVSNAVLCYMSVFHVFQVGFNENIFNFLAVLEHLLLGAPYKPAAYVPIKMERFMNQYMADH